MIEWKRHRVQIRLSRTAKRRDSLIRLYVEG